MARPVKAKLTKTKYEDIYMVSEKNYIYFLPTYYDEKGEKKQGYKSGFESALKARDARTKRISEIGIGTYNSNEINNSLKMNERLFMDDAEEYLEFKSKRQSDGTREKYDTKVYTKILGTRDKKDYWKKYGDQYFEGVRPRKGRDVPDSISLTENKEDIYKLKTKHITSKTINKWLDKLVKLPVGDDYKKKTKNLLYNILKYSHQKYKSINLVEFDFLKDIKIKNNDPQVSLNNKKILVDNEMFEIEFNEDNGLNVESDGWDDDEIDDSGDEVMWDIDDFRIFLRFIPNENPAKEKFYHLLFSMLFFQMFRINELLSIQVADIDFKKNTISIKRTVNESKNFRKNKYGEEPGQDYNDTKTKSSKRKVKIYEGLKKPLMHLVKGRAAGEFVFRTVNGFDENGDYIFKYELNESEEPSSLRPITKKMADDWLKKTSIKAGLPLINLHKLRSLGTSFYLQKLTVKNASGDDDIISKIIYVQKALGHSTIMESLKYYVKMAKRRKSELHYVANKISLEVMKEAEEFGPFRQISLDMMNKLKKDGFKNIRFTDILAKEDVSYVRFRYESDEKTQGVNRIAQFTSTHTKYNPNYYSLEDIKNMDGENREYYKYWFRPNDDINEMIPIIIRRNQPEFDLIDKINYPPEDSNKPINEVELLRDKEIKIKRILKRLYQKKLPNN